MKPKTFKPYSYTQLSFHVSFTFAICSLCQDHMIEYRTPKFVWLEPWMLWTCDNGKYFCYMW